MVFIGSVDVRRALPPAAAYAPAKAAVQRLAGVLAAELGPQGIRVNCVSVGAVATEIDARAGLMSEKESRRLVEEVFGPITPLRRPGKAEEVAEAIEDVNQGPVEAMRAVGANRFQVLMFGIVPQVLLVAVGVTIGLVSGFSGGWLDNLLMRFTELFQTVPGFVLAVMLMVCWTSPTSSLRSRSRRSSWRCRTAPLRSWA